MKIVLVGSGNVATHLGKALLKTNHTVLQVYSRSESSAKALAKTLSSSYTTDVTALYSKADLYIVALRDEAIKVFLKKFKVLDKIIVHTSGSVSLSAFKNKFKSFGVLYPVQTFSMHHKINFKN